MNHEQHTKVKVGHTHTLPTSTTNHTPSRALLPLILIGVQDTTGTPYTHDMEMEHTNALHYTTVQRHYRYASSTEQTTDIPIRPPPRRRSYRPKSPNLSLRTSLLLFLATGFRLQLLLRILVVVFFSWSRTRSSRTSAGRVVEHAGCHRGGEVDERVAQVETPPAHHQLVGYIQSQYHMDFFFVQSRAQRSKQTIDTSIQHTHQFTKSLLLVQMDRKK